MMIHQLLKVTILFSIFLAGLKPLTVIADAHQKVQQRIDQAVKNNTPIVVHVIVALADNRNQGIVPVSLSLGNGQNPRKNLYWGALYGVKTYLKRKGGWRMLSYSGSQPKYVLERVVFKQILRRKGKSVTAYIVADAWDGKYIKQALQFYYASLAGKNGEKLTLKNNKSQSVTGIEAGGKAHLIAFIGHNGLMDFDINSKPVALKGNPVKSSIVLACKSKPYFANTIASYKAQPLVMTKGLMAPEAYTLDAAIKAWVRGKSQKEIRRSAARAYQKYQKISQKATRWLFDAR